MFLREDAAGPVALPDTLVGTDSHTTMINGLGVLGWGVGGIEAEAVMLGQPLYMLMPEVVGFELSGELPPGATATDLVLTVTQMLRKEGVVDKFVEFFGPALATMTVADRATLANMAPEYGATMGFFPVDEQTLDYLRQTGRTDAEVELVERYAKEQQLVPRRRRDRAPQLHQGAVARPGHGRAEPGRARSGRRTACRWRGMKRSFRQALAAAGRASGASASAAESEARRTAARSIDGATATLIGHGAVVIAAITSCTNTSNPERDAGGRAAGPEGGRAGPDGPAAT